MSTHNVENATNAWDDLRTNSNARENQYKFMEVYGNDIEKRNESEKNTGRKEDRGDNNKKIYESVPVHDTSDRSSLLLQVSKQHRTQSVIKLAKMNYAVGESQKTQSLISKVDNITDVNSLKANSPSHVAVRERPRTHSHTGDRSTSSMVRESHQTQSLIIEQNKNTDVNYLNKSPPLDVTVRERPRTYSHTGDRSASTIVRESHQTQSLIIEQNKNTDFQKMNSLTMLRGKINYSNKSLDNSTSDSNCAIFVHKDQNLMVSKSIPLSSNVGLTDNLSKNGNPTTEIS